ncbi:uncharacterized protein LOC143285839 [Babylonia areolata]|uniref:uncharacterized protein LOC143285839 n=1 Tax=Babylonia areolata TaxID=304850 RepID=UPI003FD4722B
MESVEKDCSALGNLFQTIINDLRNSSPIWEDFTYKATKLHQCLKTTLVAASSFLEAFQKVADMATNSRGATKEMGSALTRLCMRHRSIETCLKALTNSVLDSIVAPLQERLEDWKKAVAQLDKDHSKEYKKAKQEIKKASSDTMRLQKKVSKGKNEMQTKLESAMQEVNDKYLLLEEAEKTSVRTALIEERERFCVFISCIKPFVDHEVHLLTEVTHLQEIMHSLCLQASDPHSLPDSSEQVITDLKGMDLSAFGLQGKQHPSPPSSPSSLGSRKSSVCSMASINSCSSTSSKSHSPGHTLHKQNTVQLPLGVERLTSVSSQDSGFTSQDTLFVRPTTPLSLNLHQDTMARRDSTDAADSSSTPGSPLSDLDSTLTPSSFSTNSLPFSAATSSKLDRARPHTISAGSEKSYARLAVKPELFEPLAEKSEAGEEMKSQQDGMKVRSQSMSSESHYARPAAGINKMQPVLPPHCPKPKVKAVAPPTLPPEMQPAYANTAELHQMAMEKREREQQQGIENHSASVALLSGPHQLAPKQQNSMELAEAIRELEQSTAALHSTYDTDSYSSAQGSSGYATMDSTPSSSDDVIPPGAGTNLMRRGSMNANKPPPPVRRTASISYSSGPRSSRPSMHGEGFYAELQSVQQGIQERRLSQQQQQPPAVYSKSGQLQRQQNVDYPYQQPPPGEVTTPSPDTLSMSSVSSGGTDHYAVPVIPTGTGSAIFLQNLNAKFASLNQQYQDPQYQQQSGTYVGQGGGEVGPGAASMMPPPSAGQEQRGPGHQTGQVVGSYPPQQQGHYSQGLVTTQQYGQGLAQQYHSPHPAGGMDDLPPPPLPEEDFPLPPTEQELAEMETVYAKPPPVNPKPKMTGDLMKELKRRMSTDEYSNV